MADLKSTTIVPIAFYCFVMGAYFLYLAFNAILSNSTIFSSTDFGVWLPVGLFAFLGCIFIAIGIGILNVNQLCWRILFFGLAISVSTMASLIFAFIIFLFVGIKLLAPYFSAIQANSITWLSFLGVFLSEIIVLYYLTHEDVVSSFGGMGEMISPF